MGKIVFILMVSLSFIYPESLEKDCLACHKAQQIPNELIYRRYLMRYSTDDAMEDAIVKYLKNPKKPSSIMPPQFFLKFPMKEIVYLEDKRLKTDIQLFLNIFDIKKKLILKKEVTSK